jgi:hypothetical protein
MECVLFHQPLKFIVRVQKHKVKDWCRRIDFPNSQNCAAMILILFRAGLCCVSRSFRLDASSHTNSVSTLSYAQFSVSSGKWRFVWGGVPQLCQTNRRSKKESPAAIDRGAFYILRLSPTASPSAASSQPHLVTTTH